MEQAQDPLVATSSLYGSLLNPSTFQTFYKELQLNSRGLLSTSIDSFTSSHRLWISPKLGFSQICGASYVREYSDSLQVIGIPVYSAPGCSGEYFRSVLVTSSRKHNATSLSQLIEVTNHKPVLAVNSFNSYSGWIIFLATLSKYCDHVLTTQQGVADGLPINVEQIIQTGSHINSLLTVLRGDADLACIDGVSFALIQLWNPALLTNIRILEWTDPMLSHPFVCAKGLPATQVQTIRIALQHTFSMEVKEARQQMLLLGMVGGDDLSAEVLFEAYQSCLQDHINIANKHFEGLLSTIPTGRLIREITTYSIPSSPSTIPQEEQLQVQVSSQARKADQIWPQEDLQFVQYMRQAVCGFLFRHLLQFLSITCKVKSSSLYMFFHTIPFTEQITMLMEGIEQIVKKEVWIPLPYTGQGKMILTSIQGVLLVLSEMEYPTDNNNEWLLEWEQWWNHTNEYDSYPIKAYIPLLITLARKVIEPNVDVNGNGSATVGEVSKKNNMYFSGFMGCVSSHLIDYFDNCPTTTDNDNNKQTNVPSIDLMTQLWAADIALSERLATHGESVGVLVYLSAPRHNDRYDWGNFVIAKQEQSLITWRDTLGHSSVRKFLFPYCYEHIRLHRGILSHGLLHTALHLTQTVFLSPSTDQEEPMKATAEGSKGCPFHQSVRFQYEETILRKDIEELLVSQATTLHYPVDQIEKSLPFTKQQPTNTATTSHELVENAIRRHVVRWDELETAEEEKAQFQGLFPGVPNKSVAIFAQEIKQFESKQ